MNWTAAGGSLSRIASAPGASGPGAGQSARDQASWNRSTGSQTLCAQPFARSLPSPEKGGVTQRGVVGRLCPTCKKEGCLQTSGRAQAVSLEPEEGRVQAAGACAGAVPHSGGTFALDPILSTIKVALLVLLSITLLLELYR